MRAAAEKLREAALEKELEKEREKERIEKEKQQKRDAEEALFFQFALSYTLEVLGKTSELMQFALDEIEKNPKLAKIEAPEPTKSPAVPAPASAPASAFASASAFDSASASAFSTAATTSAPAPGRAAMVSLASSLVDSVSASSRVSQSQIRGFLSSGFAPPMLTANIAPTPFAFGSSVSSWGAPSSVSLSNGFASGSPWPAPFSGISQFPDMSESMPPGPLPMITPAPMSTTPFGAPVPVPAPASTTSTAGAVVRSAAATPAVNLTARGLSFASLSGRAYVAETINQGVGQLLLPLLTCMFGMVCAVVLSCSCFCGPPFLFLRSICPQRCGGGGVLRVGVRPSERVASAAGSREAAARRRQTQRRSAGSDRQREGLH